MVTGALTVSPESTYSSSQLLTIMTDNEFVQLMMQK